MRKQLLAVAGISAFAQCAAFLKVWVTARYFGVSTELDAYNLAFLGPSFVSGVVAGAVQSGLFPVYAGIRVLRGATAVAELERLLFWWLLAAGLSLSLAVFAAAGPISSFLSAGGGSGLNRTTAYVLRFAAFAIALNAIGDYLSYVLALRGRFAIAAAAPIANALVSSSILLLWPEGGLAALSGGTLVGVLVQSCISLTGAISTGFSAIGPMSQTRDMRVEIREIIWLGIWILPGTLLANLSAALPQVLLVPHGEGAVSAFGYAYRFHQTVIQLLVMSVSPLLLSRFSDLVANRDWATLNALQRGALQGSIIIGLIALAAVALFGEAALSLLLGHGRFDAAAAARVAKHWSCLTLGLGAGLYGIVLAKRLQADRQTRELSLISLAGLTTLLVLSWALRPLLGELAVPAAIVASAFFTAAAMARLIRWRQKQA